MKTLQIHETGIFRSLFAIGALLLLIILISGSRQAGISGDEEVHYQQSVKVYNYFASHGQDKSALDTPVSHLKYYGQSFDNLTTILIRWFSIDDIYSFRHIMNSLAAWFTILIAALFAIWLSGYGAGLLTLLLFTISPTFLGHAQNNLKDIPFALAYIAGTFFLLKVLYAGKKNWPDTVLLILSVAFCISIRPGGVLLICYLFLFFLVRETINYRRTASINLGDAGIKLSYVLVIAVLSYFLGLLLWPYALENPITGFWESYKVMARFPTTIRQIFEGKQLWSDFMPWYYLPKLMLITIPLIVWVGIIGFFALLRKSPVQEWLKYAFLIFTIIFPIVFVIYEKSNLYGSWRHFLFVYPGIVVLAATGLWRMLSYFRTSLKRGLAIMVVCILSWHPVRFMVGNQPYYYLYYSQLVGGLKGAYGNYETDYYYHSIRESSEWLISYIRDHNAGDSIKIGTSFPANWFFRNEKNISVKYFSYEERSQHDWDFYISANSYISPYLLTNNLWPPKNSIKNIEAAGIPICAVLKRENKKEFLGYKALNQNHPEEAVKYFEEVIKKDCKDELIFYNFAAAAYNLGDKVKTIYLLKKGLEINPEHELSLMFLANIYVNDGDSARAAELYQKLIGINRKYFDAYPALAKIWISNKEYRKARELLKSCLMMHPGFREAIAGLADSYRSTDPDIAKKYDELAKTKQQ
jgi:hypothetical protein